MLSTVFIATAILGGVESFRKKFTSFTQQVNHFIKLDGKKWNTFVQNVLNLKWAWHGSFGIWQIIFGSILICDTLTGSFTLQKTPLLPLYYFCVLGNSCAAIPLTLRGHGPSLQNDLFRLMASLQINIVYFLFRFSYPDIPLKLVDLAFMLFYIVSFLKSLGSIFVEPTMSVALKVSIFIGMLALLTTVFYPFTFTWGGRSWWSCVQSQYPLQLVGFHGYVYVPATYCFSIILFVATLHIRNIVGVSAMVCITFFFSFIIPATMVLHQEYTIPLVSTQRLIIPCSEVPDIPWLVKSLDLSVKSNSLLKVFGANQYE